MANRTPTPAEWSAKLKETQALGARAAKLELAGTLDSAFEAYVEAAQSYIYLMRHCKDQHTKEQLRATSNKLVDRATRIKQTKKDIRAMKRDRLSREEQDGVLERASVVNGIRYSRWTSEALGSTQAMPQPPLSPAQLAENCTWQPADAAFPNAIMIDVKLSGRGIVQNNVADCSLVTALIIAAEHRARFGSRMPLCLIPQDVLGTLQRNETGIYSARLFFNGACRTVVIDDKLPVSSKTGQAMCATVKDRTQIWPALVEKAYLKLMGGYDFAGSNSGIDLHALTGWVPEHIPLNSGFRSERSWSRIYDGFGKGDCVLTLGTGSAADQRAAWLTPSHSYAVIDVYERDGRRQVEVINPWNAAVDKEEVEATRHIDWDDLPLIFDALHLNWDPGRFRHSDTVHCSLALKSQSPPKSTRLRIRLPQPPTSGEMWILLARHRRKADQDEAIGVTVTKARSNANSSNTARVDVQSSLTDNPFFLYRLALIPAVELYDVSVSRRGTDPEFSFTLQAFADCPLQIEDGPATLPYTASIEGNWTGRSAGGSHACLTFMNNPQYAVTLSGTMSTPSELHILGETSKDSPLNLRLVRSGGERVTHLEERDVVAGDSTYNYGLSSCSAIGHAPGTYTLIVSSFEPRHEASFTLKLDSTLPLKITPIPQEGAGMFNRTLSGTWTASDGQPMPDRRFVLSASRPCNVKIRLQAVEAGASISLTVHTSNSAPVMIASTGVPSDVPSGVMTHSFKIAPGTYDVTASSMSPQYHSDFQLLVYADKQVEISADG